MTDHKAELDELLKVLPGFCRQYFIGISTRTSELTRLNYARDLTVFFKYLREETEQFAGISPDQFDVKLLDQVTPDDIEAFLYYVTRYVTKVKVNVHGEQDRELEMERSNEERAKARKLSSISSLYRYLQRKKLIEKNPVEMVEKPKIREKAIIRLDPAEVANLLDAIESGYGQSHHQKNYNKSNVVRDMALITLLLGTGIRVSECTGIDLDHINPEDHAILITRKGGKQEVVYYGDEVAEALENYMEVRKKIKPIEGHEQALFLSSQRRRITNRSVQLLVKKYAHIVTPLKHITPHKLRSTFGTSLYQETGDIYLVATVLGHRDVNTTRKHYAAQSDEQKIMASKKIRLRDEEPVTLTELQNDKD